MSLDTSFDIKNIVCLYFYDLKDTINLYNLNKDHQDNIMITNLYDIETKYKNKLNQKIIKQHKYKYIKKLYIYNRGKIKNVSHLKKTLEELYCNYNIRIDQNGISELNLIKFYSANNQKIKNVNHMKNTLKI